MTTNTSTDNIFLGNINADTVEEKKIILKMTQALLEDERFEMKQKNISDFKEIIEEAANTFCFGKVLYAIPLAQNTDGSVSTSANLLTESHLCPKNVVKDFSS